MEVSSILHILHTEELFPSRLSSQARNLLHGEYTVPILLHGGEGSCRDARIQNLGLTVFVATKYACVNRLKLHRYQGCI